MSGIIFINYRREDSRWTAISLYNLLATEFTPEHLFMDVDTIPPGVDFVKHLGDQVAKCQIMVSLIGRQWLEILRRRLNDPADFVRIEIVAALKRDIRVIPVLIDGATMPRGDELLEPLKPLARRNAVQLRHESFGVDAEKLARALKQELGLSFLVQPGSGKSFKDAPFAPEMVVVPAGKFLMGSKDGEGHEGERPQHEVKITKPFAVSRFVVTRGEFSTFVSETDHDLSDGAHIYEGDRCEWREGRSFRNPGFAQDERHPVVCVNWYDAQAYIKWLKAKTGKDYRLLSEAEWEYVARAGTVTQFWWGASLSTDQANYNGDHSLDGGSKYEFRGKTVPVDRFQPNPWGLYQVHGNVAEWLEDCWNDNYDGAPTDGSAWTTGNCEYRVCRGGCFVSWPDRLRLAERGRIEPHFRMYYAGFRVARTL